MPKKRAKKVHAGPPQVKHEDGLKTRKHKHTPEPGHRGVMGNQSGKTSEAKPYKVKDKMRAREKRLEGKPM
jgi:hypothetical protein